eukprot:TRINITY_DN7237_c0_g1_i1.p1 TRINITY_DN7237_c0_g1~~TRINITY_DN7237_c0_g1_i1.p1  ORF type:complete len:219 (+),score=56.64 TRINITY_DN7237_c0_g1_i1:61-717(+)
MIGGTLWDMGLKSSVAAVLLEYGKGMRVLKEDVFDVGVAAKTLAGGLGLEPKKVVIFENAEDLDVYTITQKLHIEHGISLKGCLTVIVNNNNLNHDMWEQFGRPPVVVLEPLNTPSAIHSVVHASLQRELCKRSILYLSYSQGFVDKIVAMHTRMFSAKETVKILTKIVSELIRGLGSSGSPLHTVSLTVKNGLFHISTRDSLLGVKGVSYAMGNDEL